MALRSIHRNGPLGIGRVLGQRLAPLSGGPGTPLSIPQPGGGASGMTPMAADPPQSGQDAGAPGLGQIGGLLGMIGQGDATGEAGTPTGASPARQLMANSPLGMLDMLQYLEKHPGQWGV